MEPYDSLSPYHIFIGLFSILVVVIFIAMYIFKFYRAIVVPVDKKIQRWTMKRYGNYQGEHMEQVKEYHAWLRKLVGEKEFLQLLKKDLLDFPNERYSLPDYYSVDDFPNADLLRCPTCGKYTLVYSDCHHRLSVMIDYVCLNPKCNSHLEDAFPITIEDIISVNK